MLSPAHLHSCIHITIKINIMNKVDSIKVRMYRHGFGDCFLLRFYQGDSITFKMLIDCGLKYHDKVTGVSIKDVVKDIAKETGVKKKNDEGEEQVVPHLDALVVTHEHWDHVSGFIPKEKLFDNFEIDNVWLAWTEDPDDKVAQQINAHLQDNITALTIAAKSLSLSKGKKKESGYYDSEYKGNVMLKMRGDFEQSLNSVLEFYGPLGATEVTESGIKVKDNFRTSILTQKALDHVKRTLAKESSSIQYFEPGKVIEKEELPGIRIYVLGPPKNEKLNKDSPSRGAKKEVYFSLSDANVTGFVKGVLSSAGSNSIYGDDGSPFQGVKQITKASAKRTKLYKPYFDDEDNWRTIEDDWLDMAGALALQMDSDTNNTSLVLAIEMIDSGKILLFPGDAQVGNWLSWYDYEWEVKDECGTRNITATDILKNTVFYKAGHHLSHNATLKEKGLEMMEHDDLVVFVPEKEGQYNGIPYDKLVKRVNEKAKGRVLFSADKNFDPNHTLDNKPTNISQKEWDKFKQNIDVKKRYIEYTLR